MFCNKCGAEINDEAVICPKCGCEPRKKDVQEQNYNEPKTGIGVLMGLFLGVIGLIIGLCLYPANTESRKTFLKGWGISFAIAFVLVIVIYIIILGAVFAAM